MTKYPVLYKTLVVGVIVLFIGVGIQPAIADVSIEPDNSELEEVTIQFFETDRTYNHTVLLTKEQLMELENIFKNVKSSLNSTDCPIETEKIYKNTIASFNELGILPEERSLDYLNGLVTGRQQDPRVIRIFERWLTNHKDSSKIDENFLCLTSGQTTNTYAYGPVPSLVFPIFNIFEVLYDSFYLLFLLFYGMVFIPLLILIMPYIFMQFFWNINPLLFGYEICLGKIFYHPDGSTSYPASGWLHTKGINETKMWDGKFYGNLPFLMPVFIYHEFYPGIYGFTGIKITSYENFKSFYLGFALWVKIREK